MHFNQNLSSPMLEGLSGRRILGASGCLHSTRTSWFCLSATRRVSGCFHITICVCTLYISLSASPISHRILIHYIHPFPIRIQRIFLPSCASLFFICVCFRNVVFVCVCQIETRDSPSCIEVWTLDIGHRTFIQSLSPQTRINTNWERRMFSNPGYSLECVVMHARGWSICPEGCIFTPKYGFKFVKAINLEINSLRRR